MRQRRDDACDFRLSALSRPHGVERRRDVCGVRDRLMEPAPIGIGAYTLTLRDHARPGHEPAAPGHLPVALHRSRIAFLDRSASAPRNRTK